MLADAAHSKIELAIAAESDRYDSNDERWLAQASDLYADLRREVAGYRLESARVTETKGAADAVIKTAARYPVVALTSYEPSLEDIFLRYYEGDSSAGLATKETANVV